jgi:uncharacterized protein (DUF488 family)
MRRIYTIGYGNQGFLPLLDRLEEALRKIRGSHFIVFDVRRKASSWCRDLSEDRINKLFQIEGYEYRHCPNLGNEGDREHIRLQDERHGLAELRAALENLRNGAEIVLLCAEFDHTRCHRTYVAERAQELYNVEVVHL